MQHMVDLNNRVLMVREEVCGMVSLFDYSEYLHRNHVATSAWLAWIQRTNGRVPIRPNQKSYSVQQMTFHFLGPAGTSDFSHSFHSWDKSLAVWNHHLQMFYCPYMINQTNWTRMLIKVLRWALYTQITAIEKKIKPTCRIVSRDGLKYIPVWINIQLRNIMTLLIAPSSCT